jgi:hypothetical protein
MLTMPPVNVLRQVLKPVLRVYSELCSNSVRCDVMWLSEPLPFIQNFIDDLSEGLHVHNPDIKLSKIQQGWLGFCLMGIILTNSICWARFERISLGKYKIAALSCSNSKFKKS